MPKLAAPSFNGVGLSPDARRVLEASLRPLVAAANKALVVGESLQVWAPVQVVGTGAGATGVTGSGTTGAIPKWSGASSLADSGASMDGSNRLAVPVGIAFPGGSTLDAAPAAGVGGSGVSGRLPIWSGSSTLTSTGNLTASSSTGALTSAAVIKALNLQVSDVAGAVLDKDGATRLNLNAASAGAGESVYTSAATPTGTAHHLTSNNVMDASFGQLLSVENAGAQKLGIGATGKLTQPATDSTATPGAVTANTPTGKAAVAASATSVVVTNALVTVDSIVLITPMTIGVPAKYKAVPAAGSFTVTVDAAPSSAWLFSWRVLN